MAMLRSQPAEDRSRQTTISSPVRSARCANPEEIVADEPSELSNLDDGMVLAGEVLEHFEGRYVSMRPGPLSLRVDRTRARTTHEALAISSASDSYLTVAAVPMTTDDASPIITNGKRRTEARLTCSMIYLLWTCERETTHYSRDR